MCGRKPGLDRRFYPPLGAHCRGLRFRVTLDETPSCCTSRSRYRKRAACAAQTVFRSTALLEKTTKDSGKDVRIKLFLVQLKDWLIQPFFAWLKKIFFFKIQYMLLHWLNICLNFPGRIFGLAMLQSHFFQWVDLDRRLSLMCINTVGTWILKSISVLGYSQWSKTIIVFPGGMYWEMKQRLVSMIPTKINPWVFMYNGCCVNVFNFFLMCWIFFYLVYWVSVSH